MFKNSLKLFCSNFDKVWKLFFYTVIILGITVGLMMPFLGELKEVIFANWNDSILDKIPSTGLLYGSDVAGLFTALWTFLSGCVVMLFSTHLWVGIYFAFLLLFFMPFLFNLGKYAVNEMLYNYMSSQAKLGFCLAFISTLKKSWLYAIFKTIFALITAVIFVAAAYGLAMISAPLFNYFLPVVVIVGFAILASICQSFVSGWAPASVVCGFNIFKSYNLGFKSVIRRYGRVISTSFVINMFFIFLIMGFGLVSSVVFIPLYLGLINMFEMVMFFGSQGMRYYVDSETFLTPKRLEQQDNIQKTKDLL